ncbi:MAG: hypothetical protein GXY83_22565 [Rhodopirellula sp.]|nr:hypothetical protein [Rhodopirellula sp.]
MQESNWRDLHDTLFKQAKEMIEVAYLKAKKKRMRNPAVLLLDLTDDTARGILESQGGGQKADEHCDVAEQRGITPIGCVQWPGDAMADLLAGVPGLRSIADRLRERLPAGFYTVVIAGGNASIRETPCP